jgi:DNA-binding Lrp family transcriptional regulator
VEAPGRSRKALGDTELAAMAADFRGTRRTLAAAAGLSERSLYRRLKKAGKD